MNINQMRALNAIRCMLVSLGENTWNLVASMYFLLKYFEVQDKLKELLDESYPYICTCNEESNAFAAFLGGTPTTASLMSSSYESAQIQGLQ